MILHWYLQSSYWNTKRAQSMRIHERMTRRFHPSSWAKEMFFLWFSISLTGEKGLLTILSKNPFNKTNFWLSRELELVNNIYMFEHNSDYLVTIWAFCLFALYPMFDNIVDQIWIDKQQNSIFLSDFVWYDSQNDQTKTYSRANTLRSVP